VRRAERIANEDCRSGSQSSAEKEVEPGAVGSRYAHGSIAARGNVSFFVIPFENDVTMARRQRHGRK
jgi:hypothetical protein